MASLMGTRVSAISGGSVVSLVLWINRGLEVLWLLTVILVPLSFLRGADILGSPVVFLLDVPKVAVLRTLVGLMAGLWLIEWGIQGGGSLNDLVLGLRKLEIDPIKWSRAMGGWLSSQPTRWVTFAVYLNLASILLSTLLSPSLAASLWGEVPGQDGYATYTSIAYFVLFGIIATHLRTKAQLWRLLGAIVTMGLLFSGYGVLQYYGYDLFQVAPADLSRVQSLTGNPIFAASTMLLGLSVSLAAATLSLRASASNASTWAKVALWASILTIQMLGITFTLSRGPWVGGIVALAGFLVLTAFFVGWATSARGALVLALAALVTSLVIFATPSPSSTYGSAAGVVSERFTSIGRGVAVAGLSSRTEIWRVSGQLMLEHPWYGFESLSIPTLRMIFGYGPEFFRGTYLLLSVPKQPDLLPWEPSQAHNYFITQGVELGFLGLLTSLGIFLAPMGIGAYLLLRKRPVYSTLHKLVLIGLISTISGRMVEQLVGLARVSDLTIFWVLLGAFVALPVLMDTTRAPSPRFQIPPTHDGRRRSAEFTPKYSTSLMTLAVAVVLIGGILSLTWIKSLNYVRAALEARTVNHSILAGDLQSSLQALDRAIELAPDVFVYYDHRAEIYSAYLNQNPNQRDQKCSLQETLSYQVCLAQQSYLNARQAVEIRPFHYRSNLALANKALALAELSGDAELMNESIQLYQRTLEMVPHSWKIKNRLASAQIQSGRVAEALPVLVESLAITRDSVFSSEALMLQGIAFRKLSRLEEAITSLDQAIYYDVQRAEAYNNRGNVYQDLGQLNKAINDYNEAIRLNPQYGLAIANRTTAYARLGEEEKAQGDADRR